MARRFMKMAPQNQIWLATVAMQTISLISKSERSHMSLGRTNCWERLLMHKLESKRHHFFISTTMTIPVSPALKSKPLYITVHNSEIFWRQRLTHKTLTSTLMETYIFLTGYWRQEYLAKHLQDLLHFNSMVSNFGGCTSPYGRLKESISGSFKSRAQL